MTFNVDQLSVLWMAVQTAEDFETKQACQQALQYYALAMTPEILAHIAKLEAALPPQGDGWQDIASAPRDGTEIDIWIGNSPIVDGGYRIVNCWWSAVDGYWFGPMGGPARDLRQQAGVPTHWRPLPEPPTPESSHD